MIGSDNDSVAIAGGRFGTFKAGTSAALSFDIPLSDPGVQPFPAPATGALLALAGLGLRRRRA